MARSLLTSMRSLGLVRDEITQQALESPCTVASEAGELSHSATVFCEGRMYRLVVVVMCSFALRSAYWHLSATRLDKQGVAIALADLSDSERAGVERTARQTLEHRGLGDGEWYDGEYALHLQRPLTREECEQVAFTQPALREHMAVVLLHRAVDTSRP